VQEIAQVYARALFEVAAEHGSLDLIHEQLGAFADAMDASHDLRVFFFSPHFSAAEKKAGLKRTVTGADPAIDNFLQALIERHRMPAIFRIRTEFDRLWDEERKLLPVRITSAVALDEDTVAGLGERIGQQIDRQVQLSTHVDPDIIGGIVLRVGNLILDASIRNRLEQLRKQVAQA
jgi:F-type H+-transporting ATPase subunit delta